MGKKRQMKFEELKEVLKNRPNNIEHELYSYGYYCGQRNVLNFEIVQQAFYIYNYPEKERLHCMRKILKGFQDGCISK